jgi:hypothetical protein
VFKSKSFHRFARSCGIDDASVLDAVQRAEHGLVDADLGSGVIKQRIARPGQGKSAAFVRLCSLDAGKVRFSFMDSRKALKATSNHGS